MARSSFIGRIIYRDPRHPGRWPGEDLLTDITAALINEIPGLGEAAVRFLLPDASPEGQVEASTQESPGDGRRLDLVLRDTDSLVVWVEVKDWAGESGDQLRTYDELRRTSTRQRDPQLVYLTRLGAASASLPEIHTRRWQEFSADLRVWAQEHAELASEHRWLLEDYLRYLKERGLVMSDPFPSDAREIAARQWQLWETLDQLHGLVKERIEVVGWRAIDARWAQRSGGNISVWPGEWWSVFEAEPASSYAACDFEVMITGLAPDDRDHEPTFGAGLVWRDDRALPNPITDVSWVSRLASLPVEGALGAFTIPVPSKLHLRAPISTFPNGSLADQADAMAKLADAAFRALRDNAAI